jgi:hypothetical protein
VKGAWVWVDGRVEVEVAELLSEGENMDPTSVVVFGSREEEEGDNDDEGKDEDKGTALVEFRYTPAASKALKSSSVDVDAVLVLGVGCIVPARSLVRFGDPILLAPASTLDGDSEESSCKPTGRLRPVDMRRVLVSAR